MTTTLPAGAGTASRFWRFWAAGAVSRTGDAVTAVALPLAAVTILDATALEVSLITAAKGGHQDGRDDVRGRVDLEQGGPRRSPTRA